MDIFFHDPNVVLLPPDEMRILSLEAQPYPDGLRVAINVEVTPFQQKPNLEIDLTNESGEAVASVSVVEIIETKLDFTLHIREPDPQGEYTATLKLYYTTIDEGEESEEDKALEKIETTLIDEAQTTFVIPPLGDAQEKTS